MLIDAFVIFFSLHGPFEAPFYKITFGRKTEKKGNEEIEQHLIDQRPLLVRRDFQYFGVNSSLKRRRSCLAAIKMQALPPFHVLTASGQK